MAELASSLCGLCMLVFVTRIQRESTIILCHLQVYIYIQYIQTDSDRTWSISHLIGPHHTLDCCSSFYRLLGDLFGTSLVIRNLALRA